VLIAAIAEVAAWSVTLPNLHC